MHSAVLVIGVSNQGELEKAMNPFFQLGCTMSQKEQADDPRARLKIEYTKEKAEEKYKEDIIKRPTKEQRSFFHSNFMEASDEDTCRKMYTEKKKSEHSPNGYTGEDFAYGSTIGEDGEGFFFLISEDNMIKARKWLKENNLDMWYCNSGKNSKEEFIEKYPDAHTSMTASGSEYIWSEELQGYGYYTNPNGFWDWFQIGGRWVGFFSIKEDKREEAKIGEPAWMMNITEEDVEELKKKADVLKVRNIDFDAMEENAKKHSADQWDKMWEIIKETKDKTEEEIDKRFREIMDATENETKEEYIERTKHFSVASIIHNGLWYDHENDGFYKCKNKGLEGAMISEDLPLFLKNRGGNTPLMLVDCHG